MKHLTLILLALSFTAHADYLQETKNAKFRQIIESLKEKCGTKTEKEGVPVSAIEATEQILAARTDVSPIQALNMVLRTSRSASVLDLKKKFGVSTQTAYAISDSLNAEGSAQVVRVGGMVDDRVGANVLHEPCYQHFFVKRFEEHQNLKPMGLYDIYKSKRLAEPQGEMMIMNPETVR